MTIEEIKTKIEQINNAIDNYSDVPLDSVELQTLHRLWDDLEKYENMLNERKTNERND